LRKKGIGPLKKAETFVGGGGGGGEEEGEGEAEERWRGGSRGRREEVAVKAVVGWKRRGRTKRRRGGRRRGRRMIMARSVWGEGGREGGKN